MAFQSGRPEPSGNAEDNDRASSLIGSAPGRNGATSAQLRPILAEPRQDSGADQRRFAAARRADHHQQTRLPLALHPRQRLDHLADLVLAAEVDAGVLGVEVIEPGKRGPLRVPVETVPGIEPRGAEAVEEPSIGLIRPDGGQVDHLAVGQDVFDPARTDGDRENRLAQRLRLGDLDEAPSRGHGARAAQNDDRAGELEVSVQLALPVTPCLDPGVGVEVQEERVIAVFLEPTGEVPGDLVILTAMAQEDARHRVIPKRFDRCVIASTTLMRIHDSIRDG